MNEQLLRYLIRLFALIAREDGITAGERNVVWSYLNQQFNQAVADSYIQRFDAHGEETLASSVNEEITRLSQEIAQETTTKQKYFILIRLFELVYADHYISDQESHGLHLIGDAFDIRPVDYEHIMAFATKGEVTEDYASHQLIISPTAPENKQHQWLERSPLEGYVAILRIASVGIYLMRYWGHEDLYLNGELVQPFQVYYLNPGSVLRANRIEPVFFTDIEERFQKPHHEIYLRFRARNVTYRFPSGDVGLHNINLDELSGRMVALMGASGAGKSTLLNVLNGNNKPSKGTVTVNREDIHNNPEAVEGVIGYVSQEDALVEELTVYDNLYYTAKLCLNHLGEYQLQHQVSKLLAELGLLEIKHLKVGTPLNKKISGGQRKRLNIALELIREPAVLFVDEPTSGLSSRDSETVIELLKSLTRQGKLIFVVIHQPSSELFKMFDRLYLLDTGGYPVFYGRPLQAIPYFRRQMNFVQEGTTECPACGNVNPEQIFNLIESRVVDENGDLSGQRKVSPERRHELHEAQREQLAPPDAHPPKPPSTLHLPNQLKQLGLFLIRDGKAKLANTSFMALALLEAPILALVLAYVLKYFNPAESNTEGYTLLKNQNLPTYLFVSILVGLFIGLTISAEEILKDRRVRRRERFLHLSRGSYLLSKVGILFLLSAFQMFLYVLVGHGVYELPGLMFSHWLVLFTISCFANLLGLNISATFDNAVTIYILVPIMLIPQIVLSGAIVSFDKLNPEISAVDHVPMSGQIMASRWAYEALTVRQFKQNAYEKHFYEADRAISQARFNRFYWLPAAQKKLQNVMEHRQGKASSPHYRDDLFTLRQELEQHLAGFGGQSFPVLEQLYDGQFTPAAGRRIRKILSALKSHYQAQLNENVLRRDSIAKALQKQGVNTEALKFQHHNERLGALVRREDQTDRLAEVHNRLVQLSDPIFQTPQPKGPLNAGFWTKFYTPSKPVGDQHVPTFYYNLVMIWLMTLLLFVALYFEVFRWLIQRGTDLQWLLRRQFRNSS